MDEISDNKFIRRKKRSKRRDHDNLSYIYGDVPYVDDHDPDTVSYIRNNYDFNEKDDWN